MPEKLSVSRVENILQSILGEAELIVKPQSRVEELLIELKDAIEAGGGGGDITALAARIAVCENKIASIEQVDTAQNTAINQKVSFADVDSTLSPYSSNPIQNGSVYTALTDKVDKVDDMGLSQNSFTNNEKTKLANLENYDDTRIKSLIAEIVDKGAKNKCQVNFSSTTVNGVTLTNNGDGSITLNGTRSGTSPLIVVYDLSGDYSTSSKSNISYSNGRYIIKGTGVSDVRVQLCGYNSDDVSSLVTLTNKSNDTYYTIDGTYDYYTLRLWTAGSASFDNLKIYPMMCLADEYDVSPNFQPYVPSNAELAENKVDIPKIISANITESDAENYSDGTVCGYANNFADGMGTWVVIRTYTLNVDKTRKMQIAELPTGVRKTRLYNGEWGSWI